ncbi:HepT-like ribonuclease domain-containing protein [Rubrivirga sp. IMCC43871]|uniref:HepT-like ribonuclease domain-containing protein n=1 Tax=Rubrivirga sp. IMCC43871 TaxID=3391575 RepID=UPI00398F9C3E
MSRIERIDRCTEAGRGGFLHDEKPQDAIVRNVQTLAESTQRLAEASAAGR